MAAVPGPANCRAAKVRLDHTGIGAIVEQESNEAHMPPRGGLVQRGTWCDSTGLHQHVPASSMAKEQAGGLVLASDTGEDEGLFPLHWVGRARQQGTEVVEPAQAGGVPQVHGSAARDQQGGGG